MNDRRVHLYVQVLFQWSRQFYTENMRFISSVSSDYKYKITDLSIGSYGVIYTEN